MDISYMVEGLRSIRECPFIEFKPVTLLVGMNNSGKSTFLRSLPLIKQSIESKNNSQPILWWDRDMVDFGDFSTSVSRTVNGSNVEKSSKKENIQQKSEYAEISFCFKFSNLELEMIPNDTPKCHAIRWPSTLQFGGQINAIGHISQLKS